MVCILISMKKLILILVAVLVVGFIGISLLPAEPELAPPRVADWERYPNNPILRDPLTTENYQVASDGQVFFDESGKLNMIYTGDYGDRPAIKLARGTSWTDWKVVKPLLFETGPSGKDVHKETSFYRQAKNGKHQIYYIGYPEELDEETGDGYEAEIYLAEADNLEGPYTQASAPIVPKGLIAGKNVYTMTSPSVVEYNGTLYLSFIGWNDSPERVTEVWVIGATSNDDGRTWSNFQLVDTPIGMEGQVTKAPDGTFVAVNTTEFNGTEGIFYSTANHPLGPWETSNTPILTKTGSGLEVHEVIAPQITFDPDTGEPYLYYTGADYNKGWWMMMAQPK